MKYRPELDGIRAVAVLAVFLFHIDPSLLPGGFLGVDVFFVISGFLITWILADHAENKIPMRNFWVKRIRRILPALAGMIAFTLLLGSALYLRPDRILLMEHAVAALLSISNFFIMQETRGYWAVSSDTLPLLHTWSLSVEEQFYFVYPLVLFGLYKWRRNWVFPSLVGLAIYSFCITWAYGDDSSAIFLMLPFRVWEMLFGAILAIGLREKILPRPTSANLQIMLQGLALLALGHAFFNTKVVYIYSGTTPLLVCVATAVLIYSFGCSTLIQKLFSHPFAVYLGKRSYSLYLYHWPILVFLKLYDPDPHIGLVVALVFVCAEASYHWIEKPFRYQPNPFRYPRNWATAAALPIGFLAVGFFSHPFAVTRDLASLSQPIVSDRGQEFDLTDETPINQPPSWNWSKGQRPDILLAGSSHANALARGLAEYCEPHGLSLVALARSSIGIVNDTPLSQARMDFARQHSPRTIILASHWSREIEKEGLERYRDVLREWAQLCDHLIVLDSPPQITIPPRTAPSLHHYLVHLDLNRHPLHLDVRERNTKPLQEVADDLPNATWIDLFSLFAPNNRCIFLPDGSFPYADLYHLNLMGVRHLLQESLGDELIRGLNNL